MSFRILAVFLGLSVVAHAGLLKPDVDFTNYDVPLHEQIVNRIKARILARLGEGKNAWDRYFIIPFAYENDGNDPEFSHSFFSFVRVLGDDRQPRLTHGLKKQTYQNREFEVFTISWLPHDFIANPHLCVFRGAGARIDPEKNTCPVSKGKNFNLEQTIKLAVNVKNAVVMWGPYEIKKEGFDLWVKRMRLLDKGVIRYRADGRLYRKDRISINCFHALSDLDKLFPDGGFLGTGFNIWGINGTARVLREYTNTAKYKGLLLEPVNLKKDRYGFVYAPSRNGHAYNPVRNASAYRR